MSEPIILSDEFVLDAKRSQTYCANRGAINHRANRTMGAIEPFLDDRRALALRREGAARPLSECLAAVDSKEGRQRVRTYLESRPFPHYEPAPDAPGLMIRINQDGTRTLGRFVGRDFQAVE